MEGLGTEIVFIPGQDSDKTCVSRPASVKHRVAREGGSCRISLHLLASLLPRDTVLQQQRAPRGHGRPVEAGEGEALARTVCLVLRVARAGTWSRGHEDADGHYQTNLGVVAAQANMHLATAPVH